MVPYWHAIECMYLYFHSKKICAYTWDALIMNTLRNFIYRVHLSFMDELNKALSRVRLVHYHASRPFNEICARWFVYQGHQPLKNKKVKETTRSELPVASLLDCTNCKAAVLLSRRPASAASMYPLSSLKVGWETCKQEPADLLHCLTCICNGEAAGNIRSTVTGNTSAWTNQLWNDNH